MEHIQTVVPTEKSYVVKLSQTEIDFLYGTLTTVTSKDLRTYVPSLLSDLHALASDEYNFVDSDRGHCAGIEVSSVDKGGLE